MGPLFRHRGFQQISRQRIPHALDASGSSTNWHRWRRSRACRWARSKTCSIARLHIRQQHIPIPQRAAVPPAKTACHTSSPFAAFYTLCDLMQSILYLLPLTSLISLSCVQSGLLHLPMVRGEVISVLGEALEVGVLSILWFLDSIDVYIAICALDYNLWEASGLVSGLVSLRWDQTGVGTSMGPSRDKLWAVVHFGYSHDDSVHSLQWEPCDTYQTDTGPCPNLDCLLWVQ